MNQSLPKGLQAEELLRRYFIKGGYFTVRGVPFIYDSFDVTDIDIWLYERPSSVSRHRIIVDTKNRSTPKAIERIFWTKGLKDVLGVEQAIVATTDKRPSVAAFGREHDVIILDGTFLARLEKLTDDFESRFTEEDFVALLGTYNPSKKGGDWKERLRVMKRHLAGALDYGAINSWLIDFKFFAEQAQLVPTHRDVAIRMVYLLSSFVCIAFDFATRDLTFADVTAKQAAINEGLRYGSQGSAGTKRLLELSGGLIERYAPEQRALALKIRTSVNKELDAIPTQVLAEHFAKPAVAQELFPAAKELEGAAYSRAFVSPQGLSVSAKSLIGALLDFSEVDRKPILQAETLASSATVSVERSSTASAQSALPGLIANEDT